MDVLIFTFLGIVALVILVNVQRGRKEAELKAIYDDALRSGNKSRALAAGRAYYSHLRKGKLTIYDEQAITNDLSTM
ncbi:hypothetical protein WBJ53_14815 [Spirosoma sp. SC4-14]|uniref:hypothetical protein n=1 Tax=Spirosoma sp. SC4-14 TaxID=3128900 RepID=UPI0030D2BAF5